MQANLQPGIQMWPCPNYPLMAGMPCPMAPLMMGGQYPMLPYMAAPYMLPGQYPMASPSMGIPGGSVQRDTEVQGLTGNEDKNEESGKNPYAVPEQYRISPLLIPLLLAPFFIRPTYPAPPPFYYYYNYYYAR